MCWKKLKKDPLVGVLCDVVGVVCGVVWCCVGGAMLCVVLCGVGVLCVYVYVCMHVCLYVCVCGIAHWLRVGGCECVVESVWLCVFGCE